MALGATSAGLRLLVIAACGALVLLALRQYSPLRDWVAEILPARAVIAYRALRHGAHVDHSLRIPMRDGVTLAASLYLPRSTSGRLPAVLVRLPYDRLRSGQGLEPALFFPSHGYAVLVVNFRGTYQSGGEFLPWNKSGEDGTDLLDWIVRQPWSNGKVGSFGCSAAGETQFALAREHHPAHLAMIAGGAGGAVGSMDDRYGYFGVFEGGIFQLASGFGWFSRFGSKLPLNHLPDFDQHSALQRLPVASLVRNVNPMPNGYDDFLRTPLADPRWHDWGYLSANDQILLPRMIVNSWGDQTVGDALAAAEIWRLRDPGAASLKQKVVIYPGVHCEEEIAAHSHFGDMQVEGGNAPLNDWYLAWFDYWLKGQGDGLAALPPYRYFVLGANQWLDSVSWPPPGTRLQRWLLASGGAARTRAGNGLLAIESAGGATYDEFSYDPANPAPTRGGPICCTGNAKDRPGAVEQADVESRQDVLVYTSQPLTADLTIAGPVSVHLRVSSSALDTDIVARLVDVLPDGSALNVQEGALRLRYRAGIDRPALMEPGTPYDVRVDMRSIAYMFRQGHRLRLDITSSSFPRLERNLNTGGNNAFETRMVIAKNRIHYFPSEASYLELPVLAGGR